MDELQYFTRIILGAWEQGNNIVDDKHVSTAFSCGLRQHRRSLGRAGSTTIQRLIGKGLLHFLLPQQISTTRQLAQPLSGSGAVLLTVQIADLLASGRPKPKGCTAKNQDSCDFKRGVALTHIGGTPQQRRIFRRDQGIKFILDARGFRAAREGQRLGYKRIVLGGNRERIGRLALFENTKFPPPFLEVSVRQGILCYMRQQLRRSLHVL